MILFADLIKGQPSVSAVHVGTNSIGRRRRRFRPSFMFDQPRVVKRVAGRVLTPLDARTSHVPFNYDPTALASLRPDQMPRFLGALTDQDNLPIETVDLASLVAIQNRVDTGKVQAWADGSIKSDKLPVVVKDGNRDLIADGHHRLAGAWLRGETHTKARVKDISPISQALKRDTMDWILPLDIRKADPDQQLVFGWASVIEKNGVPVVDKQGDIIPVSAMEPAAYDFVLFSRDQGDMHEQTGQGRLVESCIFTHEKQAAMGIDLGMVAWWTGFRVDSEPLWAAYKRGERPEFSIGGSAVSREA